MRLCQVLTPSELQHRPPLGSIPLTATVLRPWRRPPNQNSNLQPILPISNSANLQNPSQRVRSKRMEDQEMYMGEGRGLEME